MSQDWVQTSSQTHSRQQLIFWSVQRLNSQAHFSGGVQSLFVGAVLSLYRSVLGTFSVLVMENFICSSAALLVWSPPSETSHLRRFIECLDLNSVKDGEHLHHREAE
ncbi:unnamed protein product [Pleuronectes platessa]|uniref:Uncharacterized protein n=1 Tax=Pleuronectes platessa TaxID=8262 RepID=A0A9N7UYE0_PLEPL|nr:unnamed protein product [Pleuronectes platessa]